MEQEKNKRAGRTNITSVSISQEFRKLIDGYNLSPTDIFRRGLAVTLADMGVRPYNTLMNNLRLDAVRSKLKLDEIEALANKLQEISETIKKLLTTTKTQDLNNLDNS